HQLGGVAPTPVCGVEEVADFNAPARVKRIDTQTAPADDSGFYPQDHRPGRKAECRHKRREGVEPVCTLLSRRGSVRVAHGLAVPLDGEERLDVFVSERAQRQMWGFNGQSVLALCCLLVHARVSYVRWRDD